MEWLWGDRTLGQGPKARRRQGRLGQWRATASITAEAGAERRSSVFPRIELHQHPSRDAAEEA